MTSASSSLRASTERRRRRRGNSLSSYQILLYAGVVLSCILPVVASNSLYDSTDPILELDVNNFAEKVYGQKRAFFVEFYSSWCGACIGYAPTFKKFARQLQTWSPIVQVAVVNCAEDKNMPLCRDHQIAAFPTLKYFKYNSAAAEDAHLFNGDKHNLDTLPLQVAELVKADWDAQRPPEWPSFESIAASTTLQDIWSAAPQANIVAIYSQDEPAKSAWAMTINFAGDKRVQTAIASPSHTEVVKQVGTVINDKVIVYEKNSKSPVFISPEKLSFADAQEKVNEFLSQALGNALDALPPAGQAIPNRNGVDATGPKKYDDAVWSDLSQFQVQSVDLQSALAYMLTREIPRRQVISGEDLQGLNRWIYTLSKYAPGPTPIRRFLYRLNEWAAPQSAISAEDWTAQISSLQSELGNPLPAEINWLACKGSSPNLRGYTCAVWTLAHAVSVQAYKAEKNNPSFNGYVEVLDPFKQFITRFLSCSECAQNFQKESEKHAIQTAKTAEDTVMWLWNTHNSVNTRLAGAAAEDPKHPKRTFPPPAICSACYRSDGSVDADAVLQFLINYYGNIKNDPVKPDPEYTVKTFQDGKVVEAEKRRFNPRFGGAHGAEKVDDLEKAEARLREERANIDASPLRGGRQIDDFKQELLGQPVSKGHSPMVLIVLSSVALMVIIIYCKYRRNRSKFWKTFYYSNDFKLPWNEASPKQYTA